MVLKESVEILQIFLWWMNYGSYLHPVVLLDACYITELYSLEGSVISACFKAHVSFLNLQALILLDMEIKHFKCQKFLTLYFQREQTPPICKLETLKVPSKCLLPTEVLFHMPGGVTGNMCPSASHVSPPGIAPCGE